jgi:hypothetical protein
MDSSNFTTQMALAPDKQGGGLMVEQVLPLGSIKDGAGLTLTGATTPTIAAIETSGVAIVVAASQTAAGTILWQVPIDYDETSDELYIDLLTQSSGDTNTPTIDATIFRKRAGAALSDDLNPTISAAIPNNTAKAAIRTINASGLGLQRQDALTIDLITGTHTTDTVGIYSVTLRYKSSIASYRHADRGSLS